MNELSSSMVCSFQSIMDILRHRTVRTESESESDSASAREFYPNLNFFLIDDWDFSARLRPQRFPFTSDSPTLDQMLFGGCDADRRCDKDKDKYKGALSPLFDRLTVQFGGFDAVYSASNSNDHANRFDLVVTCFFIDTAENILDYIAVIYHVLRPGGLWINVGPLHYHSYGKQRQQAQTGRSRLAVGHCPNLSVEQCGVTDHNPSCCTIFAGRRFPPDSAVQLYAAAATHRRVGLRRVKSDENRRFYQPWSRQLGEKIRAGASGGGFLLRRGCQQYEARGLSSSSRRFQKQEAVVRSMLSAART